ncbi:hypothetical protein RRG08_018845 [Elysia crispata]|uniref:Uncharacterized protein n=1 Tax=Elysia crispata TaxID=231223 RepID=A0AAE1EB69_9GAST|nr:hypothetical protein RRG08_018845 [Elysia crispata]
MPSKYNFTEKLWSNGTKFKTSSHTDSNSEKFSSARRWRERKEPIKTVVCKYLSSEIRWIAREDVEYEMLNSTDWLFFIIPDKRENFFQN